MNIVLISLPEIYTNNNFEKLDMPPLALYLLAAVLKQKGNHNVNIIDPCMFLALDGMDIVEQKCVELIEDFINKNTDIICFSTNTFNWGITKYIINRLNKNNFNSKIHIILGGLHASIFDNYALKVTNADFVIRGEGEITIVELCKKLEEKKYDFDDIDGITYKLNGMIVRNNDRKNLSKEELENTVIPDFSLLPELNPYKIIPVESSRGCLYSCAFCSIPHRLNWRGLCENVVIDRVNATINSCKNSISQKHILFVDDCFTINPERAINILNRLYNLQGTEFSYFIEVRISNIISSNLLESLPENFKISMQIGVECGYDEGLKKIKKGINLNQLFEGLEILTEYGYNHKCFLSFIIGFPWETVDEINKTLDTIEFIGRRYHIMCNLNWLLLLPSDLWNVKEQYGIFVDESIYDDMRWMTDNTLFFTTHPLINRNIIKNIENRIKYMQDIGLPVKYNKKF